MGFIEANREQQIIFGYCLEDFVEKNSKSRFILKIIEQMDLSTMYCNYSTQGAESYDPKVLLAIWFLAYSEGITSSRVIENLCKKHMDYIYISSNLRPDHSTLCRFIQRNANLWPKYFLEIFEIAKKKNISDFKTITIDGSKIKAKSSKKQSMRQHKLERYLEAVKKDIKQYEEQIAKLEDNTEVEEKKENQKKELEKLKKKEKLLEERKEKLQERKKDLKEKDKENHQINLLEEDALMMDLGNGKGFSPAYNVQIAVDTQTQLIVACEVVQDRNDQNQFSEMHQKAEDNLGKDNQRQYAADSGYHNLEQLEYIECNNLDAVIADPKLKNYKEENLEELKTSGRKVNHLDFKYNVEEDNYICPAGKSLKLKSKNSNGREYLCTECSMCPIKQQCLSKENKKQQRTIFRDCREELAEEMRGKLLTEEAKELMLKRQTTVEPVFGNMKENLGFRRFRMKGLKSVRNEFALMCLAHNINKLFKLIFCSILLQIKKIFYSKMLLMQFRRHLKAFYLILTGKTWYGLLWVEN